MGTAFAFLTKLPFVGGFFKWIGDKIVLILIVLACFGAIALAVHTYLNQVRQLAVAELNYSLQKGQLEDLRKDMENMKRSNEATADALKRLDAALLDIDKNAKSRNSATNKRIEDIKNDPNLTAEQKDQEISVTYIRSIRSTYCRYQPQKCPELATEKKP